MSNVPWLGLAVAGLASLGMFVVGERGLRSRWSDRSIGEERVGAPYRESIVQVRAGAAAPSLIRAGALSGLVLGGVAVPGTLWAMATLQFDGIAVALLPLLASTFCAWCTGWLLLARSPRALELGQLAVHLSRANSLMLFVLALLHVVATRAGWADRASTPYVSLALVLALAAFLQAALLHRALQRHAGTLPRGRDGDA